MTTGPGAMVAGSKTTRSAYAPSRHAAAVAQAVEAGGHVGEQVHGLLEREQLVLAHGLRRASSVV